MPKIVNSQAVRQEIIEGAYQVFVDKGFYKTSLADITAACNMKRTTVYHYFKNKEEIFEQTAYYVIELMEEEVLRVMDQCDMSLYEKVRRVNGVLDEKLTIQRAVQLSMEMATVIMREEKELFMRMQKRMLQAGKQFAGLLDEIAKQQVKNAMEKMEYAKLSLLMNLMGKAEGVTSLVSDSILSTIALLS